MKETLANAGIDTRVFKAHSVRGSSTSKLGSLGVPVSEIMAKAQWKTESTFNKFYRKPLLPDVSHKMLYNFVNNSNKRSCGRLIILGRVFIVGFIWLQIVLCWL